MTVGKQHEKPVYVRLRETIADAILAGRYGDGDPLPSVRALAAEQQANPLTVAKAYQGFQDEGLVVVKRGVGMFVAPGARVHHRRKRMHDRRKRVDRTRPFDLCDCFVVSPRI